MCIRVPRAELSMGRSRGRDLLAARARGGTGCGYGAGVGEGNAEGLIRSFSPNYGLFYTSLIHKILHPRQHIGWQTSKNVKKSGSNTGFRTPTPPKPSDVARRGSGERAAGNFRLTEPVKTWESSFVERPQKLHRTSTRRSTGEGLGRCPSFAQQLRLPTAQLFPS